MATHQKVRALLKKEGYKVGHYLRKGLRLPWFIGGDIIVSSPCPGVVHVSFYRKRDVKRLLKIMNFLKEKGFSVKNWNDIYCSVE